MRRPWAEVVSAQVSANERNSAVLPVMVARMLRRSRVDRASRSSLVTMKDITRLQSAQKPG